MPICTKESGHANKPSTKQRNNKTKRTSLVTKERRKQKQERTKKPAQESEQVKEGTQGNDQDKQTYTRRYTHTNTPCIHTSIKLDRLLIYPSPNTTVKGGPGHW